MLDSVHLDEDILALDLNPYADFISCLLQFFRHLSKGLGHAADIHNHHHVEISLYDGLGNIQDVNLVPGQLCAFFCDDSYRVFSYYSDNCLAHFHSPHFSAVLLVADFLHAIIFPEIHGCKFIFRTL